MKYRNALTNRKTQHLRCGFAARRTPNVVDSKGSRTQHRRGICRIGRRCLRLIASVLRHTHRAAHQVRRGAFLQPRGLAEELQLRFPAARLFR